MRFLLLIACATLFAGSTPLQSEERKFPYEAIVDAEDGESVWSGPGPKFYPTDKLRKGDRVMVHRHDPGGWCMIAPPPGSFSWIRAEYVQKSGPQSGVLKANDVVVHIGSNVKPDEFMTVQAHLSKGDAVEILGEKEFRFDDTMRLMYKISPVKREWRWIARKSIVPADAIRTEPFPAPQSPRKKPSGPVANLDEDAFARPISTGPIRREERDSAGSTDTDGAENSGVRKTGPDAEQLAVARKQLDEIDNQFRDMIRQEPTQWNLDSLDEQYRRLDGETGMPSMTATIGSRLDAVKRYREIHKNYLEFTRLSEETRQRDAELLALQSPTVPRQIPNTAPPQNVPPIQPIPQQPQAQPQPQPQLQPQPQPQAQPQPQRPAPPQGNGAPAFDGAGIVQKMAKTFPGGPQYVLIAPDGRFLAYLQPAPGVDLNRHVGRAMGIIGPRAHRDDWNADTITVRSLQPVQLKGTR
ncbi:hypothetical protein [Schlesneria sp. DSM 10557]|uniref:hypothetical protein n=1 Tax=Schlesneria sp. DSM 10557 TaxID=3044399 RepID=UPI00359F3563